MRDVPELPRGGLPPRGGDCATRRARKGDLEVPRRCTKGAPFYDTENLRCVETCGMTDLPPGMLPHMTPPDVVPFECPRHTWLLQAAGLHLNGSGVVRAASWAVAHHAVIPTARLVSVSAPWLLLRSNVELDF